MEIQMKGLGRVKVSTRRLSPFLDLIVHTTRKFVESSACSNFYSTFLTETLLDYLGHTVNWTNPSAVDTISSCNLFKYANKHNKKAIHTHSINTPSFIINKYTLYNRVY